MVESSGLPWIPKGERKDRHSFPVHGGDVERWITEVSVHTSIAILRQSPIYSYSLEFQEAGKRLRLERLKGGEVARSRFGGLEGFEGAG